MDFKIESVKFVVYPQQFHAFRTSRRAPIGRDLYRRGKLLQMYSKVSAPTRTYALRASIYMEYHSGPGSNPYVKVGSKLNYAYYVHEGTRPHIITPKTGRTLRFMYNGRVVYARKVNHPGTQPNRYLARNLSKVIR